TSPSLMASRTSVSSSRAATAPPKDSTTSRAGRSESPRGRRTRPGRGRIFHRQSLPAMRTAASSFSISASAGSTPPSSRISLACAYVSIFRGTPLLVQMLLIYFGPPRLGLALDPLTSAILALTLFSAAYLSENFRAGILSVDKGQWEAADSLGMDRRRTITR